jgi:hypothetical protein
MHKFFSALLLGLLLPLSAVELRAQTDPSNPQLGADGLPLGKPHSEETIEAYKFRTSISSDAQCQEIAREADRVFANSDAKLDDNEQRETLKRLGARAKALGCT